MAKDEAACVTDAVTVIITDDDQDFARLLQRCARTLGQKALVCRDGEELVHVLHACTGPALVFLDIHMSRKDGIEVIDDIKRISIPYRLRFMTGGSDTHAVAATLIAKARDIDVGATLYKPFPLERFREVMSSDAKLLLA